VVNMISLLD